MKIGINGFGRIGRCVLRALAESGRSDLEIVAVNSRSAINIAAHLLQHDTTHGKFASEVKIEGDFISFGKTRIHYSRNTDINAIDWKSTGAEVVLECSGKFNNRADAAQHLKGGARKVLISAPAKNADAVVVFGVNHHILKDGKAEVVSAASCTTNCLAPVAKTLHDNFNIVRGWMSTVHAMTADQRLLDESHDDLRRARSAVGSIIPSKTGAASSIGLVIPELQGKLGGIALRVPVANVSLMDLTCQLAQSADANAINDALRAAAAAMPPGVMRVCDEPLVSADFNHEPQSAIVDAEQTLASGELIKVMAWYDNEWGFANRMLDVAALM